MFVKRTESPEELKDLGSQTLKTTDVDYAIAWIQQWLEKFGQIKVRVGNELEAVIADCRLTGSEKQAMMEPFLTVLECSDGLLKQIENIRADVEQRIACLEDGGPQGKRREPIPDRVKMFVWERDSGRCVSCGSREKLEYDHIIPLSLGGSNTARNIQLLCESCNRSKSGKIV